MKCKFLGSFFLLFSLSGKGKHSRGALPETLEWTLEAKREILRSPETSETILLFYRGGLQRQ
jgi:hypothetical protein